MTKLNSHWVLLARERQPITDTARTPSEPCFEPNFGLLSIERKIKHVKTEVSSQGKKTDTELF